MRFFVALLATAVVLVGCGSEAGERASATSDARGLLNATVENLAELRSATVDLKADAKPSHGDAMSVRLQGPFELQEKGLPKFSFAATMKAGAQTQQAGATWTGEEGYATLNGTSYEVPGFIVGQLTASFEQALQAGKGGVPLLGAADVTRWVPNPRNEGLSDVGGVETVKLTGAADVPAVLADLERLGAHLRAMRLPGMGQAPKGGLPKDLARQVEDLTVTVFTGAEDRVLRRLVVSGKVADERNQVSADLRVDLALTAVGEEQEIEAPKNARPFSELMGASRAG